MSLGLEPGAAVTMLYAATAPPVLARGRVRGIDGNALDLTFEAEDTRVPRGACVILEPHGGRGGAHLLVRVVDADGGTVRGVVERTTLTEKREYPRCFGSIPLEYRAVSGSGVTDAVRTWMAGGAAPGPAYTPDPFMNFSLLGLAFDDLPRAAEGDTLLLDLRVPPDLRTFRAAARVVRVAPIPVDERDDDSEATHRIAVAFDWIEEEAAVALRLYTARIQEAFIEGTP
jgi:hypothetical protein